MSPSPAYHLRTNKAIERLLFIELLEKLNAHLPSQIENYRYVGMGGPYLEDFSLIHGTFGNRDMVSLETASDVRTRQEINRPCSRINLTPDSTKDFAESYTTGETPLIIWFDYQGPQWKQQLSESCDLLQKLPPMSIFKITLAGNTSALDSGGIPQPPSQEDRLKLRAEKLSTMFPDAGPFKPTQITKNSICATLYWIFRQTISGAVPDTGEKSVRTLAAYEYNDGTPILTVTMVVGPLNTIKNLVRDANLANWPYAVINWKKPKAIAVPHLGLRERLAVDCLLPDATARAIVKDLKLRLADNYSDSVKAMNNYLEFYQYVPQFLRISL